MFMGRWLRTQTNISCGLGQICWNLQNFIPKNAPKLRGIVDAKVKLPKCVFGRAGIERTDKLFALVRNNGREKQIAKNYSETKPCKT